MSEKRDEKKLKTIWFLVRRFDLADLQKPPVMVHEVRISDNCSSFVMLQAIRKELNLLEPNIVLKLKNHAGSLIIPKGSIEANTKSTPYPLEVARVHQSIKPKEKSVVFPEYTEVLKTTLQGFVTRIERIESELPEMNNKRQYKIEREMQELDRKLSFLERRFNDAEQTKWQGMLKKNPLW